MKKVKLEDIKFRNSNPPERKFNDKDRYVIVRTYSKGVFVGYLIKRKDKTVYMKNARRIKYWDGAASLSQLCMEGVKNIDETQILEAQDYLVQPIEEVIEILDATPECFENVSRVKNYVPTK